MVNGRIVAAMHHVPTLLRRHIEIHPVPNKEVAPADMGTVVFPDSAHKFYLTASAEIRAERRLKQLNEQGLSANICDLIQDINARDERDSNRPVAPLLSLQPMPILIDTSFLDQEGVFNEVWQHIQASI